MPGRGAFVRDVQLADAVRPLDMFSHGLTFSSFHQHDKFIEGSYLYNNIEWYVQDNYQMAVALHNPLGPVANAATLHFALSTPNFLIQEDMLGDVPWRWKVVHGSLTRDSGYWLPPRGHGLGVEVDEQAAARHPFKQEVIHSNTVRGNDGAILEW
jgi:hypothetical protein